MMHDRQSDTRLRNSFHGIDAIAHHVDDHENLSDAPSRNVANPYSFDPVRNHRTACADLPQSGLLPHSETQNRVSALELILC